jgi:protein-disulfide isomerase
MDNKQNTFSFSPTTIFVMGIIIAILVILSVGFFILLSDKLGSDNQSVGSANLNNQPQAAAPTPSAGTRVNIAISSTDHIRGNSEAPVKIIEFSDYECPYCQNFHNTMQQVMEAYGDQVAWIYKHFPLSSIHPQAEPAAEAAECVAEQAGNDGFWQFSDAMFANQSQLGSAFYSQVAGQIGVNMNQFNDCVSSGKYQAKIQADLNLGSQNGVDGTPGNFINGIPLKGAYPFENVKQIIDSELN